MAHYRKINVDGYNYEYVIGKSDTKIKGVGLYRNSDIGDSYDDEWGDPKIIITPSMIATVIRSEKCYGIK